MKDELTTKDELNTLYEHTIVNEQRENESKTKVLHQVHCVIDVNLSIETDNEMREDKLRSYVTKIIQNVDEVNYMGFDHFSFDVTKIKSEFPYIIRTWGKEDMTLVRLIYLPKSGIEAYDDDAPVLGSNQELKEIDKVDEDLVYDFMPGIIYSLTHAGEMTGKEAEKLFDENETFLKDYIITSTGEIDSDTMAEIIFNNMEE